MNYNNFIATPIGDIWFKFTKYEKVKISHNNSNIIYNKIEFADTCQFAEFMHDFDWKECWISNTDNGLFLKIALEHTSHGFPSYKIYSKTI